MQRRLNFREASPEALKAMIGLETYLSKISISRTAKELIKIRASQLNGCAYCINIHTQDAVKNGEKPQRIFLLGAWREAGDAVITINLWNRVVLSTRLAIGQSLA